MFRCGAVALALVLTASPSHAAENAHQWKSLFNGHDLTGWQAGDGQLDNWTVDKHGILRCTGKGHGWLSTADQYANFELELEFRVPPGGNSGVFLRSPRVGDATFHGMEVQVLDDYHKMYADILPYQYCGSLYAIAPAKGRANKHAGQWKKFHIVCDGRRVQVTLNGQQVVDVNLDQHKGKADKHPGILRTTGYIGLQNHGTGVDYRNVRVRVLPAKKNA